MLVSQKRRLCTFCRIGDTKWIEQELVRKFKSKKRIGMPKKYISSVVSCKGKVYLFFFGGVTVVNFYDSCASIKTSEMKWNKCSIPGAIRTTHFYVESCGEIFQVNQIHLMLSREIFLTFDIFKLDLSTMDWVKVESLGDRIFLLSSSSTMSLSGAELGVKGNCVYYSIPNYAHLYRFDMDDGAITVTLPLPNVLNYWKGPFWMVPDCKLQVKKELAKVEEAKSVVIEERNNWKELQTELLELIFSRLYLGDCIRFRLTCKAWISTTQLIRTHPCLTQPDSRCQEIPWLLSFQRNNKGICNFCHPIYNDAYVMNIPELAGAIVRHAKHGWLLVSQGDHSIFFFNPVTKDIIKLPDLPRSSYSFTNISFSTPPTTSDCVVFGHKESHEVFVEMLIYSKEIDIDTWSEFDIDSKVPYEFIASYCNPIFYDGVFYCLSKDGKLGILRPLEREDNELMWKVLPVPAVISYSDMEIYETPISSYIVECDGEILSVFMGIVGKPVSVFKLDVSKMKWVTLATLGDKVIFLSHATSLLVPAGLKGTEDRIYLPKFRGNDIVFYSLRTGNYHSFGDNSDKDSRADWINTREHWNCTWIQSNMEN
ncbi:hypothetical protein IFM89_029612 [Coptis chinensis]|uniref:KIB1-4 beta-propeller domain-containing protein n=1 Tax=Coptis chinensis TaxID=261450 RepID=A0A835M1N5_9MAGN|nr:hypothetical protein IFM89_029612 [Coptis chinensis]